LLHDLNFCDRGLVGVGGGSAAELDVDGLAVLGEVGESGGIGAFLGDSYDVLMSSGLGRFIVRIESPSSSEISVNVD
jgi:hypothetical protein